jgi:hypothetical protein
MNRVALAFFIDKINCAIMDLADIEWLMLCINVAPTEHAKYQAQKCFERRVRHLLAAIDRPE